MGPVLHGSCSHATFSTAPLQAPHPKAVCSMHTDHQTRSSCSPRPWCTCSLSRSPGLALPGWNLLGAQVQLKHSFLRQNFPHFEDGLDVLHVPPWNPPLPLWEPLSYTLFTSWWMDSSFPCWGRLDCCVRFFSLSCTGMTHPYTLPSLHRLPRE